MADVSYQGMPRRIPRIDRLMKNMEGLCRRYDTRISYCMWLLVLLVVWAIFVPGVVSTVEYAGEYTPESVEPVVEMSRAENRVLYRVIRAMNDRCIASTDAFVLAPQISVDGKPYRYSVLSVCADGMDLINPEVLVSGKSTGVCLNEYRGISKRVTREYPVTIGYSGDTGVSFTLMTLDEVCPLMFALDLLTGTW